MDLLKGNKRLNQLLVLLFRYRELDCTIEFRVPKCCACINQVPRPDLPSESLLLTRGRFGF